MNYAAPALPAAASPSDAAGLGVVALTNSMGLEVAMGAAPLQDQRTQAALAMLAALRGAGYEASAGVSGTTSQGRPWSVEVLARDGERCIGFAIQLDAQPLADYEARTATLAEAGAKVVWLVRAPRLYASLEQFLVYQSDVGLTEGVRPCSKHLAALPFDPGAADKPDASRMRVLVHVHGEQQWISLAEFSLGVMQRRLVFSQCEWCWRAG